MVVVVVVVRTIAADIEDSRTLRQEVKRTRHHIVKLEVSVPLCDVVKRKEEDSGLEVDTVVADSGNRHVDPDKDSSHYCYRPSTRGITAR